MKTADIGTDLLQQAMESQGYTWRDLPTPVLVRYAELCRAKEWEQRSTVLCTDPLLTGKEPAQ